MKTNVYTCMHIICKWNANVHSHFICHCRIWEQPKSPTTSKWIASHVAPTQGTLLAVSRSSYCFTWPCGKNRRRFCSEKHLDSQGPILYDFMWNGVLGIWAQVSSARVLGLQGGCEHQKSEGIVGEMMELLVRKGWEAYPTPCICSNTEIKPVNPKGNQPWVFIGRTDAEAEASILWPPDAKSGLTGKDPDPGKEWRQEDEGMTEEEMTGWHHQVNGHEFEQTLKDSEGQGSLACCSPWGCKESKWLSSWTTTESCMVKRADVN